jgi:hypothetical protein
MNTVWDYSKLRDLKGSDKGFLVSGIDLADEKRVKVYKARLAFRDHAPNLMLYTATQFVTCLPETRFLTTELPYPFTHVPLTSVFWIKACDLQPGMKVAVAPRTLVQQADNFSAIANGHKVRWEHVMRIVPGKSFEYYGVEVDDTNNYIMNGIVTRAYGI